MAQAARRAAVSLVLFALTGLAGAAPAAKAPADTAGDSATRSQSHPEPHPGPRSERARLAPQSLLLDAARAGQRIVAVGERGHVLISDDAGASWDQVVVPTRATLTAVTFADPRHGWAVGHDSTILHTDDGGAHWRLQHRAAGAQEPLFDVWFRDTRHGYAAGAYGTYLVTDDGGRTWTHQRVGREDYHLNALVAGETRRMWLAGEAGHLYRSEDGGRRWRRLAAPYEGSFFGALRPTGGPLLIFGLRGHLYRSDDGGERWRALATGTEASLMDGRVLADGRVVLVGLSGTILIADRGARRFMRYHHPLRPALAAVLGVEGGLLLFGDAGVIRVDFSALAAMRQP